MKRLALATLLLSGCASPYPYGAAYNPNVYARPSYVQAPPPRHEIDYAAERQKAEAAHICNVFADGCLSDAEKQENDAKVMQQRISVECYAGDQEACRRHPGGVQAAIQEGRSWVLYDRPDVK